MINHVKKCTVSLLLLWNSQNIICAPKAVVPSSQNNNRLSFAAVVTPVVALATGITLWKVYRQQKELQFCRDEIKKLQNTTMVAEREYLQNIKDEIINDVVESLGRVIEAKGLVMHDDLEVVVYDNGVVALQWAERVSMSDASSDSSGSTQEFLDEHDGNDVVASKCVKRGLESDVSLESSGSTQQFVSGHNVE